MLKKTDQTDRLLLSPVVTEKATSLGQYGKYVFAVPTSANRIEIAKAVQIIYGVTPIKVNIINTSGKDVRYGRTDGRTKDWKKAIVTLKEGESINIQDEV
ncbi:MAG: 50S ribosomal protein L23 [Patescibacteria group bacterium]|nr:50S ribosomal protein L23 [Patescibacteria group bacterium]